MRVGLTLINETSQYRVKKLQGIQWLVNNPFGELLLFRQEHWNETAKLMKFHTIEFLLIRFWNFVIRMVCDIFHVSYLRRAKVFLTLRRNVKGWKGTELGEHFLYVKIGKKFDEISIDRALTYDTLLFHRALKKLPVGSSYVHRHRKKKLRLTKTERSQFS